MKYLLISRLILLNWISYDVVTYKYQLIYIYKKKHMII